MKKKLVIQEEHAWQFKSKLARIRLTHVYPTSEYHIVIARIGLSSFDGLLEKFPDSFVISHIFLKIPIDASEVNPFELFRDLCYELS